MDGRGQDYSYYPYLVNGSERITYDVINNSFSGTINSIAQGYGSSLIVNTPSNAIYFNINNVVWTGLIPNHLQGYGNNSFGNTLGAIYTYIKCPMNASRWGQ